MLFRSVKNTANLANDYFIDPYFRDFVLLDPAEFMSRNASSEEVTIEDMTQEEIFSALNPEKGSY